MLTQIKLTNFKCFKEQTVFPLSKFNLLTGINGGGKSTLLQVLLLMRQSIEHDERTTQLILNGSCVNLGSSDEIKHRDNPVSSPIFFELEIYNSYEGNEFKGAIRYQLQPEANDEMILNIPEILVKQHCFLVNPRFPKDELNHHLYQTSKLGLYQLSDDKINYFARFDLIKLVPHYTEIDQIEKSSHGAMLGDNVQTTTPSGHRYLHTQSFFRSGHKHLNR